MSEKYRRYKNRLEMFLASHRGKRILNFLYSWGAAVVILGALFKLLHLPFGNQMLFVGMMTEFFVFFISGFEKPSTEYQWEEVFPELEISTNPMDKEEMEARRRYLQEKAQQSTERVRGGSMFSSTPHTVREGADAPGKNPCQNTGAGHSSSAELLPQEQLDNLKESIGRLSNATEQLARIGEMANAMADNYEQLRSLGNHSASYADQVASLNRNISGLNTIYELQLKGVSSQIDTIERINIGLQRIRDMYDSTVIDSTTFRTENERMASQLTRLNEVYARLLNALTVNMGSPGTAPRQWPQSPPPSNDGRQPESYQ